MFHKVKSVIAQEPFILIVSFAEGATKRYDAGRLIGTVSAFSYFEGSPEAFLDVTVDPGGYGISWNDDLDLSCEELWDRGEVLHTRFDGIVALSDATQAWGLNESTLRKAVARGRLIPGIDVNKYGKQWVVSTESMKREYGEPQVKTA